ncbi:helix-turn-helix domain-containing protein [Acidianus sp. HS-5]|uniref:helix-turn-helix domain-containing protein n=1 Tax=Acidianus sp. HS-5 TaxID=2886040 RepID=UPI001F006332|nr:helix-turn-helix domain-containing protein [Acidianus sp. HS-5]BDC17829.1 TrmB family transcriptional regulator [Acidianus sp. HS-5]
MERKVKFPDGREVEVIAIFKFVYGLSDSELEILKLLVNTGGKLTAEDIASSLNISRNTVTKPVNMLVSKGLVLRDKEKNGSRSRPRLVYFVTPDIYHKLLDDLQRVVKDTLKEVSNIWKNT